MIKKLTAVIFSVLLTVSMFAGCGDKDDKNVSSNTASTGTTSSVTSDGAVNSASPDVNTDTIEIGGADDKVLSPDIVITPGMEDSSSASSDDTSSGTASSSGTSSSGASSSGSSSTSSKGSHGSSSKTSSSADPDSDYYDDWEGDNVIDFSELLG